MLALRRQEFVQTTRQPKRQRDHVLGNHRPQDTLHVGEEHVAITHGGAFSCTNVNVVCSGSPQTARYNVAGTQGQVVNITAPNVTLVNQNDNTQTLLMTVSNPGTVTLTNAGAPGSDFNLGGSITVSSTTVDGVYLGTFNVTVDY